jgi:uncharacterized membrane protein
MNNNQPTWFGFNLTQKQAVYVFVFALIGLLICIMTFITFFSSMIMNFYYMIGDPYYDPYYNDYYIVSMLFSSIPMLIFFTILLVICSYSISRCRKTAAYYRQFNSYDRKPVYYEPQIEPQSNLERNNYNYSKPMYCANCGAPRKAKYQFCVNCGYEFK